MIVSFLAYDSQRPCCLFMHKVLLKFGLSMLRRFRDFESSWLSSAVGLDELKSRRVLMINFIISRLEIRDSQILCYLFSPLFHRWFFSLKSRHSSSYLFLFLPPALLCFSVALKGGNLQFLHQQQREWASKWGVLHLCTVSSHHFFCRRRLVLIRLVFFSFSVILTVVTAMDLRTLLVVSLVLLVVPTRASKWTFWSRALELLFWWESSTGSEQETECSSRKDPEVLTWHAVNLTVSDWWFRHFFGFWVP